MNFCLNSICVSYSEGLNFFTQLISCGVLLETYEVWTKKCSKNIFLKEFRISREQDTDICVVELSKISRAWAAATPCTEQSCPNIISWKHRRVSFLNQSFLLIVYKLSQQLSDKLQATRAVVVVVVVVVVVFVVEVVSSTGSSSSISSISSSSSSSMFLARQLPLSQSLLIHEVTRSHITTHHTRQDSSGWVISCSMGPLPDKEQHSQQTNIHPPHVRSEPTISAGERPQTYTLDRVATGIGRSNNSSS